LVFSQSECTRFGDGQTPTGFWRNASNDGTITVPEASSATPRILQEVVATGVQALEIASQLTVSG